MYRVVQAIGDTVPVPRVVFAKLSDYDADETRFKVALYMISNKEAVTAQVAKALGIQEKRVETALCFWQGAGLLEQLCDEKNAALPEEINKPARRRVSQREILKASLNDPNFGVLSQEIQRVLGGVVSENDNCVFAALYMDDDFPVELILMAARHCVELGKVNAKYIEKVLFSWRRENIIDCETADAYLKTLEVRKVREKEIAELLGLDKPVFSLAETRRIAQWYEEFAYDKSMIEAAMFAAGGNKGEVKYLAAILRKWHAKGYKNPKDVQQKEQNHNLRVEGKQVVKHKQDMLLQQNGYVPMKRRGLGE